MSMLQAFLKTTLTFIPVQNILMPYAMALFKTKTFSWCFHGMECNYSKIRKVVVGFISRLSWIFDLCCTTRKDMLSLPGGFIPGPHNLRNTDSFLFLGLHHLAAIQKEGLHIWDAYEKGVIDCNLFYFLSTADGPSSVQYQWSCWASRCLSLLIILQTERTQKAKWNTLLFCLFKAHGFWYWGLKSSWYSHV